MKREAQTVPVLRSVWVCHAISRSGVSAIGLKAQPNQAGFMAVLSFWVVVL